MMNIHATAICIDGRAVLLMGPSGCGKSDLAIRLIDDGATLIADDRTDLRRDGDLLVAGTPKEIAGMIELRGIGLMRMDYVDGIPVELIAELIPPAERLPQQRFRDFLGVAVPVIRMSAFEPSSTARIRLALRNSLVEVAE